MNAQSKAIIAALVLFTAAPALAGPLEDAVTSYNNKKYADCVTQCQLVLKAGDNEKAHYYLGLAYQGMSQIAQARGEYQWVATKGKDATLKNNATIALRNLSSYSSHRAVAGSATGFQRDAGTRTVSSSSASQAASSSGGGDPAIERASKLYGSACRH